MRGIWISRPSCGGEDEIRTAGLSRAGCPALQTPDTLCRSSSTGALIFFPHPWPDARSMEGGGFLRRPLRRWAICPGERLSRGVGGGWPPGEGLYGRFSSGCGQPAAPARPFREGMGPSPGEPWERTIVPFGYEPRSIQPGSAPSGGRADAPQCPSSEAEASRGCQTSRTLRNRLRRSWAACWRGRR